jgi:hypothetical protein
MKILRSKRFPDRQLQMIPDNQWEQMKKEGRAKNYTVTEFGPIRVITALKLPELREIKKVKPKKDK